MQFMLAVVAAAVALALPATASADTTAQRADRVMHQVASRMTHAPSIDGVDMDSLSLPELLAHYDNGEQLYIRCGPQALVAQAVLARSGIRSRLINTLAAEGAWDQQGDGHTFLELWNGIRWIAYDPDGNRQPVDRQGRGIGAVQAVYSRPFHWRFIATDPFLEAFYYPFEQLDQDLDHAMGIVAIQTNAPGEPLQFDYHVDGALRERVEGYGLSNWTWVGRQAWRQVTKGEGQAVGAIQLAAHHWRIARR